MTTQLNKVELIGTIGKNQIQVINDTEMIRFTLSTIQICSNVNNSVFVETTWHNIIAFKNESMPPFDSIIRGLSARIIGRIRKTQHMNKDGNIHSVCEILASKIEILQENAAVEE